MRIAIIGAGFAALSLAMRLRHHHDLVLFHNSQERSPSSFAAGLLHKFGGIHLRKNLDADLALQKSCEQIVSQGEDLLHKIPIFRVAQNEEQIYAFQRQAAQFPEELTYVEKGPLEERPGVYILQGYKVDCKSYIERLQSHFTLVSKTIHHLDELDAFDRICIAGGAGALSLLSKEQQCHFSQVKGQLIVAKREFPLEEVILGKIYLIPEKKSPLVTIGATYERGSSWVESGEYFRVKMEELMGKGVSYEIKELFRGTRVTTPSRLPYIGALSPRHFLYTGLGSKGLLYHALYAERLAPLLLQ